MTDSRKTGRSSTVDELQRLQDLVLGEEKDRLHKLDRRVKDLELRTSDVAEVLPGAMSRLIGDPASKPEIERPIVDTIRGAIKRDTQSFAEALFPVLGPAIRRAVADALMSLVQRVNVALEHSFTLKGLRWRLEAVRTGVPFAQIVLRHTMLYAVQEAFLIQRKSGLVLASVRRDAALALDEDAVSAMLTAIQAFIQDSFGMPTDEPLRSAELGDRTLWVINGPEAVLACVISGSPPRQVRDELMDLLETMHARFGDRFHQHPEALAGLAGLNALMGETLLEEVDEATGGSSGKRFGLLWIAAGLALAAYLLWSGWSGHQGRRLEAEVVQRLGDEPGYVLTTHEISEGRLHVTGLRDPFARAPGQVLEEGSVPAEKVVASFRPYRSLDHEIILRRLRGTLELDPAVGLNLVGSVLSVNGPLDSRQYAALDRLTEHHPVIRSVRMEGSRLARAEAVELIRTELQAPASVAILPADDRMLLSGTADAEWFAGAIARAGVIGGWPLDFTPLRTTLLGEAAELISDLDGVTVQFADGYDIDAQSLRLVESLGPRLARLQRLSSALGEGLEIRLVGFADGIDTAEKNREVSLNRARTVLARLSGHGVDPAGIAVEQGPWQSGRRDLAQRKVVMHVAGDTGP